MVLSKSKKYKRKVDFIPETTNKYIKKYQNMINIIFTNPSLPTDERILTLISWDFLYLKFTTNGVLN